MPSSRTNPNPRMMITLNAEPLGDIDAVAKSFLNQVVYVNWPHNIEAKVVQIFDATKHIDGLSGNIKTTDDPSDFNNFAENLTAT